MDVGTRGPPTCFRYPNAASWHHLAAGGLRESVLSAGAAVQTPPSVSPGNLLPVPHGPLSPAPQLAALPCAGLAPGAPPGHPSLPPRLPAQRGDLGSALPRAGWALGACPRCCQRLHSGPPGHAGAPSGTEEQGWGLGAGLCWGPALAAARVQPASLPRVPLPPPPEWCAHRAGLYPLCDGPRQPGTGATGPCRGALVSPRMLQADWSRVLSWLELSERRLEVLHDGAVCRTLARSGFVRFIPCPRAGILPTSHAASTRGRSPGLSAPPAQQCFSGGLSDQSLAVAPASPWAAERPGCWQSSGMPYPSVPLARFPDLHGSPSPWDSPSLHSGASLLGLGEVLLDEQLLLAGIQASLRDASLEAAVGGVQLSKSSVSSLRSWYSFFMLHGSRRQGPLMPTWTDWASSALLSDRLQQLERMGFPTEQAVVALAATGRVEGAVSLLIGGQVGDEAVVTLESRPVCHEHLLPTEQAVPCFPTTE